MDSTLQYVLLYSWHTRVVQSFRRLTWSIIIHEFSISPPTYICLTKSTPLPRISIDNLKTNTLSLDYPKNLLPWTYLKPEWSLSFMILFIIHIPLRTKLLPPNTKLQQFGEARVLNLSTAISKDELAKWCPSSFNEDLRRWFARNYLLVAICIA